MVFLYRLSSFLGMHLPLKLNYFIARRIADIHYLLKKKIKEAVRGNIRQVLISREHFGEKPGDRYLLRKYVKESFYNFAMNATEFAFLPRVNKNNLKRFVTIKGQEYLDQAFKYGKGVISITAHLGNWELAGATTSILGYPMNAVALPHKEQRANRIFVERRESQGVKIIPWGGGVKKIIQALRRNELVALLGDRLIGEKGIEVEFFGKKAMLPRGPAAIALKMNCPLLPGFLVRIKGGKFLLSFEPPILPTITGNKEKDLEKMAQQALSVLEKYISAYLPQWLNFQPIWK